ncbi:hypothetical protein RHGRI_012218 [Rhododendron griersonianum]|uniref:CCHC-type domain-containing protein n=1 Tax=Rhododendron griersonianum TaxID=479676 RepID=A0AAV6KPL2_9ERIC|nr:hypothetical protein RHGRI_012218 [Rhododendron griersonianum]
MPPAYFDFIINHKGKVARLSNIDPYKYCYFDLFADVSEKLLSHYPTGLGLAISIFCELLGIGCTIDLNSDKSLIDMSLKATHQSGLFSKLTTYEKEEYALLVEIAKRVEKDVQDYNDNRESYKENKTEGAAFGKSGGGNSRGGGQKSQVTKTQDLGKSQGGSSGWWKGKAEQGPSRQTMSGATTMSRQCFSCGSTNHLKRDCPSALKSIKCYTCGEFGHMAAQCPRAPTPAASSVGSVQGGRGGGASGSMAPGRVFAITRQGAQASPGVVTGTLVISGTYARVFLDPGSTHSFVSNVFTKYLDKPARVLNIALAISTPVGDVVVINVGFSGCELVVGGRKLLVDLLPLDITDFDIILGMDFLSGYHAVMGCFCKEVVFHLPNSDEVKFCGDSVIGLGMGSGRILIYKTLGSV